MIEVKVEAVFIAKAKVYDEVKGYKYYKQIFLHGPEHKLFNDFYKMVKDDEAGEFEVTSDVYYDRVRFEGAVTKNN